MVGCNCYRHGWRLGANITWMLIRWNCKRHACWLYATYKDVTAGQCYCNIHAWWSGAIMLNSLLVGYKNSEWVWSGNTTITNRRQPHGTARNHRRHDNCGSEASVTDIPAGTPPTYKCICKSYRNACLYSMCQMAGCNCHKHACCFRAKFKDMGTAIGLIVLWSCYIYNCWPGVLVSDMCA